MPTLPLPLPPAEGAVALVLQLAGGACELAPAERGDDGVVVTEVAAAVADWAATQGTVAVALAGTHAPCDGGPKTQDLAVPVGGWAIGLTRAPSDVRADGIPQAAIEPLGDDHIWWHVPAQAGAVVFRFPDGLPPVSFALRPDRAPAPPGWAVTLPVNEARDAPAEATPVSAALEPPNVARVVEWDGRVVVVGLRQGVAAGQIREGGAAPQAALATVTANPRTPTAVVARVGASRRFDLGDVDATAVKVLDPEFATATLTGPSDLRVDGVTEGVTWALLRRADDAIEVLVVVVSDRR